MTNSTINLVLAIIFIALLSLLIYNILSKRVMLKTPTVIVFDLDETLGSFGQLSVLKDAIEYYEKRKLSQQEFNKLIDENPEFIRPGVIDILNYVAIKRDKKQCYAIMIYTNNQGPKEWTESISNYFAYKTGRRVFDQIIAAYKINGEQIEPGRTSHEKSYTDFIRCTRLPHNTQVCFFDDVMHDSMKHENVYYINVKPYNNRIPLQTCLERYYAKNPDKQKECFTQARTLYAYKTLGGGIKMQEEQDVDVVIGKYLLQNVRDFFRLQETHGGGTKKTRRNRRSTRSKTTCN